MHISSLMHAIYSTHLSIPNLTTIITFGVEFTSSTWSFHFFLYVAISSGGSSTLRTPCISALLAFLSCIFTIFT